MTPLYWLAWSTSRMLFRNLFRCRVYHPERMPLTGPVIIAANHESYLDPPFVGSSFHRPLNYLARENLFSNWLSGPFLSSRNAVPAAAKRAAKRFVAKYPKAGASIQVDDPCKR